MTDGWVLALIEIQGECRRRRLQSVAPGLSPAKDAYDARWNAALAAVEAAIEALKEKPHD